MKKMFLKTKELAKRAFSFITQPATNYLPGQIAFFLVLSIFPILTLVGVLASFFNISVNYLIEIISTTFPGEISDLLIQFIQGKGFDSNIVFIMIFGFVLASNGTHSIILASNTLYGFPNADYLSRRIKAFLLIIIVILLFLFLLAFLPFGNSIFRLIISLIPNNLISDTLYNFFMLLRWPLAMFIIFFNIKLIYTIAPDWKILSKNTTRGALFTTLWWTVATAIYSFYVVHFSHYDIFYGSLSNIVVLMLWIYILSYILVLGISINVKNHESYEEIGK